MMRRQCDVGSNMGGNVRRIRFPFDPVWSMDIHESDRNKAEMAVYFRVWVRSESNRVALGGLGVMAMQVPGAVCWSGKWLGLFHQMDG